MNTATKNLVIALMVGMFFTLVPSHTTAAGYTASPVVAEINYGVVGPPPVAAAASSKRWANIDFSSRRLANNVWGAPAMETLTSGVYLNSDGSFGWNWIRSDPKIKPGQTCVRPIYPSVRIGASPWEPSNSASFPIQLGNIRSLTFDIAYSYTTIPAGSYDLAYDMFLAETGQPSCAPKIRAEVMVWLQGVAIGQPANSYQGDYSDGLNTYGLYSWVMPDGRLYYSFILKGDLPCRAQHVVNAKKLIDNLGLDSTLYVSGVELGNEIWNGSGKIQISQFNVNVNGADS